MLAFKRILKNDLIISTITQAIPISHLSFCNQQAAYMEKPSDILKPPNAPGMKELDRAFFNKEIILPCVTVASETVEKLRHILKPFLIKMPNLKPIISGSKTAFLLNPIKITKWSDFDDKTATKLTDAGVTETDFSTSSVNLNFNNWNSDELLRAVLPSDFEIARGFSKIGHIVHLNLRDHHLDYKGIIGEILLAKIPNTRTVVNKTSKIDNTYRNFSMELICGEADMVTQVKENGIVYEFDFSQVYWNPRLSTEHQRTVDSLQAGDVLFDVFCGVGPFAIPAARKKCQIFANDLNPHSYKWLNHNIKLNKVKPDFIQTFNKDGGDFIVSDVKQNIINLDKNFDGKVHVAMNLPALALGFIKFFRHLFKSNEVTVAKLKSRLPKIHVYFFVVGEDPEKQALADFKAITELDLTENDSYQYVRNVSPLKNMVKISFTPPLHFLMQADASEEPAAKKCRSDP